MIAFFGCVTISTLLQVSADLQQTQESLVAVASNLMVCVMVVVVRRMVKVRCSGGGCHQVLLDMCQWNQAGRLTLLVSDVPFMCHIETEFTYAR